MLANARLAAAAPEMLSLLEEIDAAYRYAYVTGKSTLPGSTCDRIKSIIARAKGEAP